MPDDPDDKPASTASEAGAPSEPAEPASVASAERDADAPASAEEKSSEEPKKKRKKKKKKRAEAAEAEVKPAQPVLGPEGWERPGFVLDFPKEPELDKLVRAFELGNYAYVREHAKTLAERGEGPEVRAAAAELGRRIEPDPLVKILLGMALALFVFMVFYAYRHGH